MGLILEPTEIKNCTKQMKSQLESNRNSYDGALQTVQKFAGNDSFKSESWDTLKGKVIGSHQLISSGMMALHDCLQADLDIMDGILSDAESLDEDMLIQDILRLQEECNRYIEMIQKLRWLARILMGYGASKIQLLICLCQEMLENTKMELEILQKKLYVLREKADQTSVLFTSIDTLIQAVDWAINDAEVYISGRGELSGKSWEIIIPNTINNIQKQQLDSCLQKELDISLKEFEELYDGKVNGALDYMTQNNIYRIEEENSQIIVTYILESISDCSVTVKDGNYQFQYADNTVIHEFTTEKIKEKMKLGMENDNWKIRGVTIPETVTGTVNGNHVEYHPFDDWCGIAYNESGIQKNQEGRYKIAVGPRILNPEYPDDGKVWGDDFNGFSHNVNIVLESKITGEEKVVECYVSDIKAHSYNSYPDGQPYNTGDVAEFNVENGIVQTGIAYPHSSNAKKDMACSTEHMGASVIEFMGSDAGFDTENYTMKSIIILED